MTSNLMSIFEIKTNTNQTFDILDYECILLHIFLYIYLFIYYNSCTLYFVVLIVNILF